MRISLMSGGLMGLQVNGACLNSEYRQIVMMKLDVNEAVVWRRVVRVEEGVVVLRLRVMETFVAGIDCV